MLVYFLCFQHRNDNTVYSPNTKFEALAVWTFVCNHSVVVAAETIISDWTQWAGGRKRWPADSFSCLDGKFPFILMSVGICCSQCSIFRDCNDSGFTATFRIWMRQGCRTSIHLHHCSCTSTLDLILLTETWLNKAHRVLPYHWLPVAL